MQAQMQASMMLPSAKVFSRSVSSRAQVTLGRAKTSTARSMRFTANTRTLRMTVRAAGSPASEDKAKPEAPVDTPEIPKEGADVPQAEEATASADFVVDKDLNPDKPSMVDGVLTEMGLIEWPQVGT
eukprot:4338314-Pyramimonas_sp.AAC.1